MQSPMVELPQTAWIAIGCIAAASTLAVLHALGSMIQTELQATELKLKVARLRTQYRRRLAQAEGQDVIVVDEAPPTKAAA